MTDDPVLHIIAAELDGAEADRLVLAAGILESLAVGGYVVLPAAVQWAYGPGPDHHPVDEGIAHRGHAWMVDNGRVSELVSRRRVNWAGPWTPAP